MANRMANRLLEPLLENGIRNTHFFNGRILTADDLNTDQEANRRQHGQLGQAIGEGVAYGLEVTLGTDGTSVTLTPGLAINRLGQVLELRVGEQNNDCLPVPAASTTNSLTLELSETPADGTATPDAGLFGVCTPPVTAVPSLTGVYLLVLSPASGFQGRAPMKSLSTAGLDAGCGNRYAVEGVTFRLVGFPPISGLSLTDPRLQNLLAHLCYGTAELQSAANYPFADVPEYGALDSLRSSGQLTDCDVPLALLQWQEGTVKFCDLWAVRRPLAAVLPQAQFPVSLGPRRTSESLALFLQFQAEVAQIPPGDLRAMNISQTFRFLPPAGYFVTSQSNFPVDTFFQPFAAAGKLQRFTLAPAEFRRLIESSWLLDPIDLDAAQSLPDLKVYLHNNGANVLFVRSDASLPVVVTPPTGRIEGTVTVRARPINNIRADRETISVIDELDQLVINATDTSTGKSFPAVLAEASLTKKFTFFSIAFTLESLPIGTYSVVADSVVADLPRLSGNQAGVAVLPNQTTSVSFELFPVINDGPPAGPLQ